MADKYTEVFDKLKKHDEQRLPFIAVTHVEYKIVEVKGDTFIKIITHWEDLITNAKKTEATIVQNPNQKHVVINPFTKKGPYFINGVMGTKVLPDGT